MRATGRPGALGPVRQAPDSGPDRASGDAASGSPSGQLDSTFGDGESQAAMLEAIRPLAGGLSHELNNILNVILGFGDGLLADLAAEAQKASVLEEMLKAARRGTELTQQLLAFSQLLFLQPRMIDLNDVVRAMQPAARELVGPAIQLELQLCAEPCTCKLDRRQVERALTSLIVCACDGMREGGRLTIRTSKLAGDARNMRDPAQRAEPGQPEVLLSIADTGEGFDAASVARLFEPFYASKQLGRGFGLGLAAVYGIVSQCGGRILVDSAPGVGTVFKLYFAQAGSAASAR